MEAVRAGNAFYRRKLADVEFDARHDPIAKLPFTTRPEIEHDQTANPPFGGNLTHPLESYCRYHQTSGTSGRPMCWLDTAENWVWWKRCWGILYRAAGVTPEDRFGFPASFGPFIGFWGAFESAVELGNLSLPAGGMTTSARLRYFLDNSVTFVCCTPTYALRMAEVAAAEGIDLASSSVRGLIVAGEPGGSIPATRRRLESAWGARVFDHAGMTEVGPWGFECVERPGGMHIMESEFIAEIIQPDTLEPVEPGGSGELVLTNLGRIGSPLIRYRTGDQVQVSYEPCACGRRFAWIEGGVLGRLDDMLIIRGNNVFPSAIEGILRELSAVAEFRIEVDSSGVMAGLRIEIEPTSGANTTGLAGQVADAVRDRLHFKPEVVLVESGALPRFELKARRVVRRGG
ncbi:MAG: AMP-binding protein [Planctomycetes bacterium]|nr:AMP-binding protein [Planctomycetota bacterium]